MAQNEEKMQADQAAFGAHYIDDTIHADKSSRTAAFIKKFLQRKTAVLGLVIIPFFVVVAIVGPSSFHMIIQHMTTATCFPDRVRRTGLEQIIMDGIFSVVCWSAQD